MMGHIRVLKEFIRVPDNLFFLRGPYLSTPLKRNVDTTWGGEMGIAYYWKPYDFFHPFLLRVEAGYDITADAFDFGVISDGPYLKGILDI
jgi:hypothetical protein